MLPNDFPPGKVCLITSGNGRKVVFGRGLMNSPVRKLENQAEGRKARTRMIDSQAVKRQKKGAHYDAGQKIKARKGHLLVDRLRLIPSLSVQAADRPDPDGAKWRPPKVAVMVTGLTLIRADGGDGGKLMAGVQDICGWRLEIVTGSDNVTEFKVVSKGWIAEPTSAGLDRYRRWSKDSEIWLAQVKI